MYSTFLIKYIFLSNMVDCQNISPVCSFSGEILEPVVARSVKKKKKSAHPWLSPVFDEDTVMRR